MLRLGTRIKTWRAFTRFDAQRSASLKKDSNAAPAFATMSKVINVSNDLGKRLLEGWVCLQS